jgi:hypothetical protein
MPVGPNDLTTLAAAKAWIATATMSSVDDGVIQEAVTAASQYFLNKVGRPSMSTVTSFTQRYNGNGNQQLFPLQDPIISISSLTVGCRSYPPSNGVAPGYLIDASNKSIYLIASRFDRGIQNVVLTYSAGFTAVPQDVATSVEMLVAQMYKRRSNVDQASVAMPQGGGTTSYRSWEADPFVMRTIQYWTPMHR